tara:strand:- start:96 stop:515 length:420 start_codon:yes stop_codon:yes gene_type:complete
MIINNSPLFHGTNERYWDNMGDLFVPYNWTDSPLESLTHGVNSVKRHGSKILLVSLPIWDTEHIGLHPVQGGFYPESSATWYRTESTPWPNDADKRNESIQVYGVDDIEKFVEEYFNEKQMEYWNHTTSHFDFDDIPRR